MIDLYTVKKNNTYTYYTNADAVSNPVSGETVLASETNVTFTRGYSYSYNGTDWVRIQTQQDINTDILSTINNICNSISNWFFVEGSGVSNSSNSFLCECSSYQKGNIYLYDSSMDYASSGDITISSNLTIPFKTSDLIYIDNSDRNSQRFGYISAISGQTITLDRDLTEDEGKGLLLLSYIPENVEKIMSQMIWFDTYQRNLLQEGRVERESEGNYSISYKLDGLTVNGLVYPASITNGLKSYQLIGMK